MSGLGSYDCEPDAAVMKIAPHIGLEIEKDGPNLIIGRKELKGFEFDARNNPDLVPPLETLACFADGTSEIRGVRRLVYKESDRLHSLPAELVKMGAALQIEEDRVIIHGGKKMIGGVLDSHGDHRVAMACAAASLGATGESIIQNSEVVSKSYPDFFQDLARLGAPVYVE
jgi:3-phosphoshikimate 1-carboxyvinyltransferase